MEYPPDPDPPAINEVDSDSERRKVLDSPVRSGADFISLVASPSDPTLREKRKKKKGKKRLLKRKAERRRLQEENSLNSTSSKINDLVENDGRATEKSFVKSIVACGSSENILESEQDGDAAEVETHNIDEEKGDEGNKYSCIFRAQVAREALGGVKGDIKIQDKPKTKGNSVSIETNGAISNNGEESPNTGVTAKDILEKGAPTSEDRDHTTESRIEKTKTRERNVLSGEWRKGKERKKAQVDFSNGEDFRNGHTDSEGDDMSIDMDDSMEKGSIEVNKESEKDREVISESEDSSLDSAASNDGKGSSSNDSGAGMPLLSPRTSKIQMKYHLAYIPPGFETEESRPFFLVEKPDFKMPSTQRNDVVELIAEKSRICEVCSEKGHAALDCENLKCRNCGSQNTHFSHACPLLNDTNYDQNPYYDSWRCISSSRFKHDKNTTTIHLTCYYCSGNNHFGDDCPSLPPPSLPGSFSLSEINSNGYATQEWLLKWNDILTELDESGEDYASFGRGAGPYSSIPIDPFAEYRKALKQSDGVHDGAYRARDGERLARDRENSYLPSKQRDRERQPVRSMEFDRYRTSDVPPPPPPERYSRSPPPPPPLPPGPPPRRRYSRSPPRREQYRESVDSSSSYRRRSPEYHSRGYSRDQHRKELFPRGGDNGGLSRGRDGDQQRKEYFPRVAGGRTDTYRPMPSAAKESWVKRNA